MNSSYMKNDMILAGKRQLVLARNEKHLVMCGRKLPVARQNFPTQSIYAIFSCYNQNMRPSYKQSANSYESEPDSVLY
jgi:hypothetical protein